MKLSGSSIVVGLIIGIIIGAPLGFFLAPQAPPAQVNLKTAGSTTVYPLSVAWSSAYFAASNGAVKLEVSAGGSGYGRTSAQEGSVDFGAASSYKDLGANIITIPIAADALAVVTNENVNGTGGMRLTREQCLAIFQSNITTWEDLETEFGLTISASGPINVYVRSDASGTTATFTKWLGEAEYPGGYNWTLGDDELIAWPGGNVVASEGNPGVANNVLGDNNGIGYVGFAFTEGLQLVTLYNEGNDEWVVPTPEAAKLAIPDPLPGAGENIFDSTTTGAYPIARLIFYLVNNDPPSTSFLRTQYGIVAPLAMRRQAHEFLSWAISETGGQVLSIIREDVGYLEITDTGAEDFALNTLEDLEPVVAPVFAPAFIPMVLVLNSDKH
jgi:ABC-type phosphate transport system substrate-binding protein